MEVELRPELQAKLARIAAARGSNPEAIAQEAIERFVDYDAWFVHEVEKGLTVADRGELMEHDQVGKLIHDRFPG
jgi:predicted transcriptional regulator